MNHEKLPDFERTDVAFSYKPDHQLKESYLLFKAFGHESLVKFGSRVIEKAFECSLPITPLVRHTIFKQFCGGETAQECLPLVTLLAERNVKTVLDYAVEANKSEKDLDAAAQEILRTIEFSGRDSRVPFAVFKMTGIARFELLEKITRRKDLAESEQEEFKKLLSRVERLCQAAIDLDVPLLIDAEESWIQDAIDDITIQMMKRYNRNKPHIFLTMQMYRWDRLEFLDQLYERCLQENIKLGVKLVRGAYMEKERERAHRMGYQDPIQKDKSSTDRDFDAAVRYCCERIDRISVFLGTHNEQSTMLMAELIDEMGCQRNDPRVMFSQLYGMSDHLTFNLAHAGYNVCKYVPYGPVKTVLPYLFRRAQENTSIKGQAGRELQLLRREMKRRASRSV